MKIDLNIIKNLIIKRNENLSYLKKNDMLDLILKKNMNSINQSYVQSSYSYNTSLIQDYNKIDLMYMEIIKNIEVEIIKNALLQTNDISKTWFSFNHNDFIANNILKSIILQIAKQNFIYKYIFIPQKVKSIFILTESFNILEMSKNKDKTQLTLNDFLPMNLKDNQYNNQIHTLNNIDNIFLVKNELFDVSQLHTFMSVNDTSISHIISHIIQTQVNLYPNYIHMIKLNENEKLIDQHMRLKKIKMKN